MHELGLLLRSGAAYSKIRKVRHGHFTLKEALLSKHWSFEHIAQNLVICGQHNSDTKLLHQSHIGQKKLTTATNRDYLEFYPAETEFLPDAEEIQHFKRLCSGEDKEAQNEVISDKDHLYLTS